MLLAKRRRRNQDERPDRRRRKLRDIEEDDWRKTSRDSDVDFEDELMDGDLSEEWSEDHGETDPDTHLDEH